MEKISVVGIGKLGIAFALNAEQRGFDVVGVDINQEYVDNINNKIIETYEPHVEDFLKVSRNFKATTDLHDAINHSNNIFVVVATPTDPVYGYDHSQVEGVVEKIISFGKQPSTKHLIICCTVLPGYTDSVYNRLRDYGWEVSYNPEFIAQGQIVNDQLYPDMILIGESSEFVGEWLQTFYGKFCGWKSRGVDSKPAFNRMSRISAEITKISLNCFLTTKIAYANMVGDICTLAGAETDKVLKAIGDDGRIGNKYLKYGFGYGGPCFPRDNRTLYKYAETLDYDAKISKASDESNNQHLEFQANEFMKNIDVNTPIKIESVTYKPGTIIIEESQQLRFAVLLAKAGCEVKIVEHPEVIKQIKELYGELFIYKERE